MVAVRKNVASSTKRVLACAGPVARIVAPLCLITATDMYRERGRGRFESIAPDAVLALADGKAPVSVAPRSKPRSPT